LADTVQQGLLPIEYLIGAPLEALVRAQGMAARTTAEFVSEVGFETDKEGVSHARMLDFEYVHPRADPDNPGNRIDTPVRVQVPALALLTVPNITVDEASFELQVRIAGQSQVQPPQGPDKTTVAGRGVSAHPESLRLPLLASPVRMIGSYTAPRLAEQTASLRVTIKLKQAPPPEGLAQILSLLGDATTARPTKDQ